MAILEQFLRNSLDLGHILFLYFLDFYSYKWCSSWILPHRLFSPPLLKRLSNGRERIKSPVYVKNFFGETLLWSVIFNYLTLQQDSLTACWLSTGSPKRRQMCHIQTQLLIIGFKIKSCSVCSLADTAVSVSTWLILSQFVKDLESLNLL